MARREFKTHDEWFILQFGKRPTTITPFHLKKQITELEAQLRQLRDLREHAEIWDEQWRASRYAWNVFDGDDE